MNRKMIIAAIVAVFAAVSLFAHAGHDHNILGTVKMVHENHLVVKTTKGEEKTFELTDATTYAKGSEKASKKDLVEGTRVAIEVENDGKTVVKVRIGMAK